MANQFKIHRLIICYFVALICVVMAQFEYHNLDSFDHIMNKLHRVNSENCHIKPSVSIFR